MSWTGLFNEKNMYPYVYRNLRERYPLSKGWVICQEEQSNSKSYIPDFIVKRAYRDQIFKAVVEVKKEPKIKQEHINQLNRYARFCCGNNCFLDAKIIAYPSGADTSIIPADMDTMRLTAFKVMNDNSIRWYY